MHTHTQVDMKVSQYARYIFEPVDTNWSVVHEDGDMKVQLTNLDPLLHVFSIPSLSSATYFPLPSFSLFPSPCPPPLLSCSCYFPLLFPSTLLPFCFVPLNSSPSSLLFFLPPFQYTNTPPVMPPLLVSIMKVYRRELEEDGVVVDPLKASYTAKVSVP